MSGIKKKKKKKKKKKTMNFFYKNEILSHPIPSATCPDLQCGRRELQE